MKKDKILTIIIIIVGILILGESYNIIKSLNIKNEVTEDIKAIDVFKEKDKSLAIMIQSGGENDFEWYEAEDRSKWPDKAKYTYVGTECTDSEGVSVASKNVLTFDETTYTAHIKTKQTIYCTLYFGKGRPALEVLNEQGGQYYGGGTKDKRTAVEGLYRFKGTKDQVTNNFVCIGGSLNPEKCGTENNNEYLYRIIGVTDGTEASNLGLEAGMLKVIKVIPSSTSQQWASSPGSDSDSSWDYEPSSQTTGATARWYLNNTFYNGLEVGIKGIIPALYWWKGDKTGSAASSETKIKTTGQYQIGLMYQSDYYNSWDYSAANPSPSSPNTNSWLHITHTMSGKESIYKDYGEWTMTRADSWDVWAIGNGGFLISGAIFVTMTNAVRPVFYLPSTTGLVGNGTESSPYVITSLSNA